MSNKPSPKKVKLVRDSFSLPKAEYASIDALKKRAMTMGVSVKKSELLRAGLMWLSGASDSALKALIDGYAREAGVRQLEKQMGKLVRKAVMKLIDDPKAVIKLGPKDLEASLGHPVFRNEQVLSGTGVITGLAWTSMGGATLPIEATRIHTLNRGFKLTGKLGDVMKESAEIAYSYVSSNLKQFGGDPG